MLDVFHEVSFKTELGQHLDMSTEHTPLSAPESLLAFTRDRYREIVSFKTAYYSFVLPVRLAFILAGIPQQDASEIAAVNDILLQLGEFFQIQDDYLDCYGDPSITGKIGTDIQDNKCSWLIVTALELATEEQLQILRNNYGKHDVVAVASVKHVYDTLSLSLIFQRLCEERESLILGRINDLACCSHRDIFFNICKFIFKRSH